jgi:hypothetical protein
MAGSKREVSNVLKRRKFGLPVADFDLILSRVAERLKGDGTLDDKVED